MTKLLVERTLRVCSAKSMWPPQRQTPRAAGAQEWLSPPPFIVVLAVAPIAPRVGVGLVFTLELPSALFHHS